MAKKGSRNVSFERHMLAFVKKINEKAEKGDAPEDARCPTLADARRKWQVVGFGRITGGSGNCDICNQSIKNSATIQFVQDPNFLQVIGRDCAQKLNVFNLTGEIVSINDAASRQHAGYMKAFFKNAYQEVPKFPARNLLSWLSDFGDHNLPPVVRTAANWLRTLHFIPSEQHVDALIEFIKKNRQYGIRELLTKEERSLFDLYGGYLQLKAKEVTLSELPMLRAQLEAAERDCTEHWGRVVERFRQGVRSADLQDLSVSGNGLKVVIEGISILLTPPYALRVPYAPSDSVTQEMPAKLTIEAVGSFSAPMQRGVLFLDSTLALDWHTRAHARYEAEKKAEAEELRIKAEEEERLRRKRLTRWISKPIKVGRNAGIGAHHNERTDQLVVRLSCEDANISFRIENAGADSLLYQLTKPKVFNLHIDEISDNWKSISASLSAGQKRAWKKRAQAELQRRHVENTKKLQTLAQADWRIHSMSFVWEPRPRPKGKFDTERAVHRAGGRTIILSSDDSYDPREGSILVGLLPFGQARNVFIAHRLKMEKRLNGSVEFQYRIRPRNGVYSLPFLTAR